MNASNFVLFYKRLRTRAYTILLKNGFGSFGESSIVEPNLRFNRLKSIKVGSNVFIGSNCWLNVEKRNELFGAILVGDNVSISGYTTISAVRSVIINPDVLIARYCYIADHAHRFLNKSTAIKNQGLNKIDKVQIKEGAWLGQSVVVCPGVTIGKNSVIGANSVVTKNIPDYSVAAGAPARVLRTI